jgi:hypothetical protein
MGKGKTIKSEQSISRYRYTVAWIFAMVVGVAFLSIVMYPRLFKNDYKKAVTEAKQIFADKKQSLNELRYTYQNIAHAFPEKVVTIIIYVNRGHVELHLDSLDDQGQLIKLSTYYDNWPIDRPIGLRNKMMFSGVKTMHNKKGSIYFKLKDNLLFSNTGYFIYSEGPFSGVFLDENWYLVFEENQCALRALI